MASTTTDGMFEQSMAQREGGAVLVTRENAEHFDLPERNIHEIVYSTKMGAKTFGFHIGELEPNSHGGTHRHLCEAMIYIIEGSGYTMLEYDQKVEWKAGDGIYVPPMAWHSHHTGDEPVQFLGMWNVPLMESMGMYYLEEAGDSGRDGAERVVHDRLATQYVDPASA